MGTRSKLESWDLRSSLLSVLRKVFLLDKRRRLLRDSPCAFQLLNVMWSLTLRATRSAVLGVHFPHSPWSHLQWALENMPFLGAEQFSQPVSCLWNIASPRVKPWIVINFLSQSLWLFCQYNSLKTQQSSCVFSTTPCTNSHIHLFYFRHTFTFFEFLSSVVPIGPASFSPLRFGLSSHRYVGLITLRWESTPSSLCSLSQFVQVKRFALVYSEFSTMDMTAIYQSDPCHKLRFLSGLI